MTGKCNECGAEISLGSSVVAGEIIGCPDCGLDYVVVAEGGSLILKVLELEGEDWGE